MPDIFSRTHLLFIDKRDRQLGQFLPGRAITCCIVFAHKLTLRLWGFWFRCILLGANIQPPVVAIREKNLEYIVHKYWQISLGVEKMPAVGMPTSSALHGVGRSPSEVCHCGSKESRPKYLPYTLQLPLSLPAGMWPFVLIPRLVINSLDGLYAFALLDWGYDSRSELEINFWNK